MEKSSILKHGKAQRVVFFYPGEEGTYLNEVRVTLYSNGIVHLKSDREEITTYISNIEIVWEDQSEVMVHPQTNLTQSQASQKIIQLPVRRPTTIANPTDQKS